MTRSGSRTATLLATLMAALGGVMTGCLLQLPAVCGDGLLDVEEEECDPAVPGASPLCDPTCKMQMPVRCGDGHLDPDEQCDSNDFGNKDCPSGEGFLSCTTDCKLDESTCDPCGNGRIDIEAGEECDPRAGTLLQPKNCSELSTYPLKPYTSGQMTYCIPDKCLWYRGPCGYCGDNEADLPQLVDLNFPSQLSEREVCDGPDAQITDLRDYCRPLCPGHEPLCKFDCADGCKEFAEPPADLQCCAPSGATCPGEGDPLPCCAAYDAGLADLYSQEACADRWSTGGLVSVCK